MKTNPFYTLSASAMLLGCWLLFGWGVLAVVAAFVLLAAGARRSLWPHACDRCKAGWVSTGMSFFDEEWCCLPCLEDERLLPSYTAAREAERREVTAGNQRYPGIGLTEEDRSALADRRRVRRLGAAYNPMATGEVGETPAPGPA